jgi:hypothetical protein
MKIEDIFHTYFHIKNIFMFFGFPKKMGSPSSHHQSSPWFQYEEILIPGRSTPVVASSLAEQRDPFAAGVPILLEDRQGLIQRC